MGKVNVYNSGSFSEESQTGESELKIGLFFDGTANNLYNTDARKYVIYKDKSERKKKKNVLKKSILKKKIVSISTHVMSLKLHTTTIKIIQVTRMTLPI